MKRCKHELVAGEVESICTKCGSRVLDLMEALKKSLTKTETATPTTTEDK